MRNVEKSFASERKEGVHEHREENQSEVLSKQSCTGKVLIQLEAKEASSLRSLEVVTLETQSQSTTPRVLVRFLHVINSMTETGLGKKGFIS